MEEPDDDIIIINALKGVLDCYKNLGEFHYRVVLRSKSMQFKQNRLRNTLRMMKGTLLLDMRMVQRRRHANRSANTVWHLDTAHKEKNLNS